MQESEPDDIKSTRIQEFNAWDLNWAVNRYIIVLGWCQGVYHSEGALPDFPKFVGPKDMSCEILLCPLNFEKI